MRANLRAAIATAFLSCASATFAAADSASLEETVCGAFKEWLAFSLWTSAAGKPDPAAAIAVRSASSIAFTTADGRTLRGFRIEASGKARGALLVAQGNAMLADQLLRPLSVFAEEGIDVYVFDYRGYGLSEGTPRLKAIVLDYVALAKEVSTRTPGKLYFFGISFGGIVLANAQASVAAQVDALVIDSSPSVVSDQGCPAQYDPISRVPSSAERILVIVGEKDLVVPPSQTRALADRVHARGGRVERHEQFAHPFMDADPRVRSARLRLVADFLGTK